MSVFVSLQGRNRGIAFAIVALSGLVLAGSAQSAAPSGSFGFTVKITLSEQAARKLKAAGEGLVVSASYYGDPRPGADKRANEVGQIDLGREELTLAGAEATARVTGRFVKSRRLQWIQGPVSVNVNVFSARKSSQDNILNCDFIDGDLGKLTKGATELHCALIEENYQNQSKP